MKLLVGVLALTLSAPAAAEPRADPDAVAPAEDARARASYARGRSLAARGRYQEALAEFSTGYTSSARPQFLFNMAECSRALGDVSHARQNYQRYLDEAPRGPLATIARRRIEALPGAMPPAPMPAPADAVPDSTEPSGRGAIELVVMPRREDASPSAWRSPWPWVGAGVAVLAGSVAVYALSRDGGGCGGGCVDLR